MSLVVVTPPAAVLSLDDVKAHLRVDGAAEDALITGLIAAAQGSIDGPPGWLGTSIGAQTLELRAASFDDVSGAGLVLPYGPVIEVVSITAVSADGAASIVDPTAYGMDGDALALAPSRAWPVIGFRADAVRVRYRAGYAAGAVPAPIVHALKVMVALLYENRLGDADFERNRTVAGLLGPFRRWGR